jgi:hypothetical protein
MLMPLYLNSANMQDKLPEILITSVHDKGVEEISKYRINTMTNA